MGYFTASRARACNLLEVASSRRGDETMPPFWRRLWGMGDRFQNTGGFLNMRIGCRDFTAIYGRRKGKYSSVLGPTHNIVPLNRQHGALYGPAGDAIIL